MKRLREYNKPMLEDLVINMGEKPFRAKQLYEWVHVKRVSTYEQMSNLPAGFREKLASEYVLDPLTVLKKQQAADGSTAKFLFELPDGETIESVWMRYKHGDSVCVSSQVGCRMGCSFCASTMDGLVRNLTPDEMLSQVYDIEREQYQKSPNADRDEQPGSEVKAADGKGHINSIIIMGMGEPFDNYDNVMGFVRLLTDENGRNLSARHVTISTCGLPDGILRLADEGLPITLALSLHAPNDEIRRRIMPVAKAYPMEDVFNACLVFFKKTGRRVTFEYSMIKGVNDSEECAGELVDRCKKLQKNGMPTHINLIPLNEVKEREHARSADKDIQRFQKILEKNRINVTIRREMGSEIDAACGQLSRKHKNMRR